MTQNQQGFDSRYLSIGIALGLVIGVGLRHIGIGLALGVAAGIAMGRAAPRR